MAQQFNSYEELHEFDVSNTYVCPACARREHDRCHHDSTYDRCTCFMRHHRDLSYADGWDMDYFALMTNLTLEHAFYKGKI